MLPVPTGFAAILGQGPALELIGRLLARDRVPHALLFQGPEGVGKATTARLLAASLLCERGGSEPCGACRSCELHAAGSHPDYIMVTRRPKRDFEASAKKDEISRDVRIEQIREIGLLAGQTPRYGRRRVFVIDPAERMNPQTQNALLKTLEEPGPTTVIILVSARPQLLLPTVRSRCFAVRFATLRSAELARLLEARGLASDDALLRASLADGRPGRALDLDVDALRARREQLLELLERIVGAPEAADAIVTRARDFAGADEAEFLDNLDLLETLLRDAVRAAVGGDDPALVHADVAPRLAALGSRLGASRGAALIASIEGLRSEMVFTPNRVLMTESLLAAAAGGPLPARRDY